MNKIDDDDKIINFIIKQLLLPYYKKKLEPHKIILVQLKNQILDLHITSFVAHQLKNMKIINGAKQCEKY